MAKGVKTMLSQPRKQLNSSWRRAWLTLGDFPTHIKSKAFFLRYSNFADKSSTKTKQHNATSRSAWSKLGSTSNQIKNKANNVGHTSGYRIIFEKARHGFGLLSTWFTYKSSSLLTVIYKSTPFKTTQLGISHLLKWISGRQYEHFGATSRIPDLFHRRDRIYFALQAQKLRWNIPPPRTYHDVVEAAQKVAMIEQIIDYEFKDKMLCIEALKVSGENCPLYFSGTIHKVTPNNRLALLGDRTLSLAMCELWFQTGRETRHYSVMDQDVTTRVALAAKGREIGLHRYILFSPDSLKASSNHVAETFEAIIGAVYLDSGKQLSNVTRMLRNMGLDKHPLLRETSERRGQLVRRVASTADKDLRK